MAFALFVSNIIPQVVVVAMVIAVLLLVVFALTFTPLRSRVAPVHSFVKQNGLLIAFGTALTATLGSLFYSEVMGFTPCPLCWYQRILMYPLVIILGIALVAKARDVYKYVLGLSVTGFFLAVYHYLVQVYQLTTNCVAPSGQEVAAAECTMRYIFTYGFISIPFMAAVAFLVITLVSLLALRKDVSRRRR